MKFEFGEEETKSLDSLKNAFQKSVPLGFPNFNEEFIVHTDASSVGIGAVLSQKNANGIEEPIVHKQTIEQA